MKIPFMVCHSFMDATAEIGSAGVPALGQRPGSVRTVFRINDEGIVEIYHFIR